MSIKAAVSRTGRVGVIVVKIMTEHDDIECVDMCVFLRSK